MVTILPKLCPDLRTIDLQRLPKDPVITAAVSKMLLASNRNTLRSFRVDSPLTKEAQEVVYNLPDLRELLAVIERDTPLPSVVLPSLTDLAIGYDHDGDWLQMFRGATLGKLEAVTFHSGSEQIGNLLEEFKRVALAASIQNTLLEFYLFTECSWNPNYRSLLPFTHLANLIVEFSCDGGCSSRVDDDTIMNLARAMPGLGMLQLGKDPCREIPIGVTTKGLTTLANHCPYLSVLRIHFQVASLCTPPAVVGTPSDTVLTTLRRVCGLEELGVGEIPMPKESVFITALTLVRIFPRLNQIDYVDDEGWHDVMEAICLSRDIVDYSGKEQPLSSPQSNFRDASLGATPWNGG